MVNTWRTLQRFIPDIEVSRSTSMSSLDPEATVNRNTVSRLKAYLQSKDGRQNNFILSVDTMERKIDALSQERRLNSAENIFNYWQQKKSEDNELYILSQTVLAVPSSQVSVERAFSALGLILTQNRTKLTDTNLNNVLIVKLNSDLLNTVSLTE